MCEPLCAHVSATAARSLLILPDVAANFLGCWDYCQHPYGFRVGGEGALPVILAKKCLRSVIQVESGFKPPLIIT